MSVFLKSGKIFKVTTKEELNIHERLPVGTYTVGLNSCTGQYFLETIGSFELKGKIYGDTTKKAKRILDTFHDRDVSTGVLLTGEKGSGKTMLAKQISILAASDQGIPTIVVNNAFCGESFNIFIQMIDQPVVVIFDEFEKVYRECGKQEALLTLLDGVHPSKKLFILTCNDKWRLNTNLQNRPGRIFYMLEYHGLDQAFIREYCEDNLKNKEHIPMVCTIAKVFESFNFDMLKGLVEEMNRYGETPAEVLEYLNARPNFDKSKEYKLKFLQDGKAAALANKTWHGNPLKEVVHTHLKKGYKSISFTAQQLKKVDDDNGAFVFVNGKKKQILVLHPVKSEFEVNFSRVQAVRNKEQLAPSSSADLEKVNTDSETEQEESDSGGLFDEEECNS